MTDKVQALLSPAADSHRAESCRRYVAGGAQLFQHATRLPYMIEDRLSVCQAGRCRSI